MRISRRYLVLLGISLLSLSWTSLPARAQRQVLADPAPQRPQAVPCASSDDATPSGLAVVLPPGEKGYKSGNFEALRNPFVSGIAVQINWRDIEPVEGNPDWSSWMCSLPPRLHPKNGCSSTSSPVFFLRNGPWRERKTDLFMIPYGPDHGTVGNCQCHGITCTSTAGSHS